MSTVIAFSAARRAPVRGRDMQHGARPEGGAEIVILPVVRIERHEVAQVAEAYRGPTGNRPH